MCGVIGIFSNRPVVGDLHNGLTHLQHRGQDAAGICTYSNRFNIKKGAGFVRDVFHQGNLSNLEGNWGLGHTRYSTAGLNRFSREDAQPFTLHSPYGIAMVHNGDLTNYNSLKTELAKKDKRHCNSTSDLELILSVFASKMQEVNGNNEMFEQVCKAVESVFDRCVGGYTVIGMLANIGMFAFRDPHGIRPGVWGKRKNTDGNTDYIFSSENTMYYPLGFELQGDIKPGEVIFVSKKGEIKRRLIRKKMFTPCIFEYVYLARPDSMINNISVYRSRLRMGQNLARAWKKKYPLIQPDIVVPVPFTSNTAALSMAHEIGVRYSEGLYKNVFVGRTFIMQGQENRKKSILQKLSPQEIELKGKKVLLVDDSIVRGNTSKKVVELVRNAGAKEVYFASACPPIKYPDFYGIDIPTRNELIGANMDEEQIRKFIGADILLYQTIEDLVEAVTRRGAEKIDYPSMPCLDGWYVTEDIDEKKIRNLEKEKDTSKKIEKEDKKEKNEKIKILVIGSGAREHIICKTLKKSKHDPDIFCFATNNNPGIKEICKNFTVGNIENADDIIEFIKNEKINFAFIGPEAPLAVGVVDELEKKGIPCIGPTKELAQIETSKGFTRDLFVEYNINGSAKYKKFDSLQGVQDFLNILQDRYVIKADGLMGGKGVKVSGDHLNSHSDAINYCQELINKSSSFIIEEKFIGQEFSLMSFSDGKNLVHMPPVQDNKRAFDGDQGPNTGGMGSYSSADHLLPFLNQGDVAIAQLINETTAKSLREKFGRGYKGILYGGFIKVKDGIKLIEYNARFGDPEAMNVLSILDCDFVDLCLSIIFEKLDKQDVKFLNKATVCKYAVPEGYPDDPVIDQVIDISEVKDKENLYYGSVDVLDGQLIEKGSRTICCVGIDKNVESATNIVENIINKIEGPLFHRQDIGTAEYLDTKRDFCLN